MLFGDSLGPFDALWHLFNLFAVPLLMAALAAALVKLACRHELTKIAYTSLATWAMAGNAVTVLAGLLLFGRDGRMATYGALIVVSAAALWWRGFGPGRRRSPSR